LCFAAFARHSRLILSAETKLRPSRGDDPRLSVVMPVHNALPHLDAAVQSILDQTYRDFEFVIYDDASTDGSTERLRQLAGLDPRIRLFEGKRNLGPVGSSIFVVEHSKGQLVARMDADDVSLPTRLESQIQLLREKPRAGLGGTLFDIIDGQSRRIRGPDYWRLARASPFVPFAAHGSIMFRRTVFDDVGGYRAECEYWEDQDLVARMASAAEIWVLPWALYQVRQWTRKTGASVDLDRVEHAVDRMYRSIARLEQNRGYDDLLAERSATPAKKVDPRVFVAAGSRALWAGGRPRVLGRMLKRGRLRLDLRSATSLIWGAWGTVSPSTLRAFLRMVLQLRNVRALKAGTYDAPVRWSPTRMPVEIPRNN
jgi:glycosyltransferase involved in cell wall biosynthesis